jgi:hypothetical protein
MIANIFLFVNIGAFKNASMSSEAGNLTGTHYIKIRNFKDLGSRTYRLDYKDYGSWKTNERRGYNHLFRSTYGIISVD